MHIDPMARAGLPWIIVNGAIGVHGATTVGVQVPGVSTPNAADVWAAVIGLSRLVQSANGGMLTAIAVSMIVAAGRPSIRTVPGITFNVLGASPNEHCIMAPWSAGSGMAYLPLPFIDPVSGADWPSRSTHRTARSSWSFHEPNVGVRYVKFKDESNALVPT